MKKSSKKIPKSHLPKFEGGGSNFNEFGFNVEGQGQGSSTQNIYNQGRQSKISGNQYAQMGNAVNQGAIGAYQTSQTPGLSEYEKNQKYGNSIKSAETGVVSAINPIFGMIHAGVTAATAPLTAKATQTDEQGNLKNKNFAKADIIGQGFADPMAMIPTMISNKFSMKKYINSVEDNAKGKIAAQKAQEDAYAQQQTDYQNQQQSMMDAAFARGFANQNQTGGNTYVQYAKYGGQMKYAMGGMNMQPNAEVEKQENTLNPDGTATQFNGPTHEQGGIKTNLDPGTLIFSDKVKWDGKTAADHNKPYTRIIQKATKDLENSSLTKEAKLSAHLNLMSATKASQAIFAKQEETKQSKIDSYTKRLGGIMKYPNYNQFIPGINQSKQPIQIEEFKKGGKKGNTYTPRVQDANDSEDIVVPGTRPASKDFTDVLAPDPYNTFGKPLDNWEAARLNKSAWDADYMNNPSAPNPNNTYEDQDGSKFDWKGLGTQAAYFAANNAGNIYDLARTDKTETRKYDRATASLLNDSAAMRDANEQTRRAEYNIRGASGGNAGTYLANRVGLNAQNIMTKDRIRQQYANVNAGISNQVNQFNTGIANEEILANAKIRANARSTKQSAIASMGSNSANQMNDVRNTEMDQKKLDGLIKMYPALSKDPEMLKYFMSFHK